MTSLTEVSLILSFLEMVNNVKKKNRVSGEKNKLWKKKNISDLSLSDSFSPTY